MSEENEKEDIVAEETVEIQASVDKTGGPPGETLVNGFCKPCGGRLKSVPVINGKLKCPNCKAEYTW